MSSYNPFDAEDQAFNPFDQPGPGWNAPPSESDDEDGEGPPPAVPPRAKWNPFAECDGDGGQGVPTVSGGGGGGGGAAAAAAAAAGNPFAHSANPFSSEDEDEGNASNGNYNDSNPFFDSDNNSSGGEEEDVPAPPPRTRSAPIPPPMRLPSRAAKPGLQRVKSPERRQQQKGPSAAPPVCRSSKPALSRRGSLKASAAANSGVASRASGFSVGDEVVLHSLRTKQFNGRRAKLEKWIESRGRWCVQLLSDGQGPLGGPENDDGIAVQPQNLRRVARASRPQAKFVEKGPPPPRPVRDDLRNTGDASGGQRAGGPAYSANAGVVGSNASSGGMSPLEREAAVAALCEEMERASAAGDIVTASGIEARISALFEEAEAQEAVDVGVAPAEELQDNRPRQQHRQPTSPRQQEASDSFGIPTAQVVAAHSPSRRYPQVAGPGRQAYTVEVVCPARCPPGTVLTLDGLHGETMEVEVPENVGAGDIFLVEFPAVAELLATEQTLVTAELIASERGPAAGYQSALRAAEHWRSTVAGAPAGGGGSSAVRRGSRPQPQVPGATQRRPLPDPSSHVADGRSEILGAYAPDRVEDSDSSDDPPPDDTDLHPSLLCCRRTRLLLREPVLHKDGSTQERGAGGDGAVANKFAAGVLAEYKRFCDAQVPPGLSAEELERRQQPVNTLPDLFAFFMSTEDFDGHPEIMEDPGTLANFSVLCAFALFRCSLIVELDV